MTHHRFLFVFALLVGLATNAWPVNDVVLVNKPASANDTRYDYPHALLQLILNETEKDYSTAKVATADNVMSRERMYVSLLQGSGLHVVAEAPKRDWTENLSVIRVPIRKGIQGYRLLFINEQDQKRLSEIESLNELRSIPTGSGVGWSTTLVMTEAGFNVIQGTDYEGLFEMLKRGRFKTFSRGINEIGAEYIKQKPKNPDLAIDNSLALYIPLPTYFFVSPAKPVLAERIEKGLEKIRENGKFNQIFLEYHAELLGKYDMGKRKIFELENPNLTAEDPINDPSLWHKF